MFSNILNFINKKRALPAIFQPDRVGQTQILLVIGRYMFKVRNEKAIDVMNIALNVFSGNSKDTRTTAWISFLCFYFQLLLHQTGCCNCINLNLWSSPQIETLNDFLTVENLIVLLIQEIERGFY